MTPTRRRLMVVALAATLLSVHAMPAQAHEVRYGTNGGLGGNVFYNTTSGGQAYCVKGSGWINHPGSGGQRARASATTWFRKGANASGCSGSSSTAAAADDNCFNSVAAALIFNGMVVGQTVVTATGIPRTSLTATIGGAGTQAGTYTMKGNHYWNSAWPGSCQGSASVGGTWSVGHSGL